jgi:hypothetical protein
MRNQSVVLLLIVGLAPSALSQDKGGDPASQVILDQPQSVQLLRKNGTQTRVDLLKLTRKEVQFKQAGSNTVLTYTAVSGNVRAIYTADGDYYAVNPQTGEFDRFDPKTNTFGVLSRAEKAAQEAQIAKANAEEAEKARLEAERAKRDAAMAKANAAQAERERRAAEQQARLEAERARQESLRANREAERPRPSTENARIAPEKGTGFPPVPTADPNSTDGGKSTLAVHTERPPKPLAITLLVGDSLLCLLGLLGCALHYCNSAEARLHRGEVA